VSKSWPPSFRKGRCYVIGEVALTHDGSLGLAHAFVDAIAATGADAVKFQTHIAAAESTPGEPFRVQFSRQDTSRYDYWVRTSFSDEQWHGLADHARDKGLDFISSPFSLEAVTLLERVGVPLWKVASGEVGNFPLLDAMAHTGRPLLLSSGMSPFDELDASIARIRAAGADVGVMQCTTAYPCPPEKIGLNVLSDLRKRYSCPVGLSDHSGTVFPSLAAAALGADVVEVHVALSREMFGPDVVASITTEELKMLVEGVRFTEAMLANPVNKNEMARETAPLRKLFTRSVVLRTPLPAGALLEAQHLAAKKPGTGIPAARLPEFIGRRLKRALPADALLSEDDVEESA
jgi:N,N'-diacetyllegionaminate synthase